MRTTSAFRGPFWRKTFFDLFCQFFFPNRDFQNDRNLIAYVLLKWNNFHFFSPLLRRQRRVRFVHYACVVDKFDVCNVQFFMTSFISAIFYNVIHMCNL